jgi:hypothetical protein
VGGAKTAPPKTLEEFFVFLPCVSHITRERIARELDDRGPEVCLTETLQELSVANPEILDIATKCAASFGQASAKILLELCVFYRLLAEEFRATHPALRVLAPIPRVTKATRAKIVGDIDQHGVDEFTLKAVAHLEQQNPELLDMANGSATRLGSYLPVMQGFALVYRALVEQAVAVGPERSLH